ncbi:signal recognition particle receptor subunit alpha-like [Ptychodera flava]|uniref:signal recognition particle receptor subunit alpha-like n=1 Tax=Ptychodera flava TaxID=63121 RepID=UPI003969E305
MLDLFTIFSKGGIVLWYFQGTCEALGPPVNALIKSVILQERGGSNTYNHQALTLKYKLDNEFELVFVVAYQKILTLSYVDKFIDDVHQEFRDKYKDDLKERNVSRSYDCFTEIFQKMLKAAEESRKVEAKKPKQMRTFQESEKSKKKVSSMIIDPKKDEKVKEKENKNKKNAAKIDTKMSAPVANGNKNSDGSLNEEEILRNREKLFNKMKGKKSSKSAPESKNTKEPKKREKQARVWSHGGTSKDAKTLDFSDSKDQDAATIATNGVNDADIQDAMEFVGTMKGELDNIDTESSEDEDEEVEEEETTTKKNTSRSGFGVFSMFKGLVGSKTLTKEDVAPALDKMKDHLIAKNVAADIADKLCESVATKLEGKVLGTFDRITSTVKNSLNESLVQILSPRRRIDILRDVLDTKNQHRPYVITFCGVNGVGKSTNLAKICFWLVENGFRVLVAACDTFRAGAVEQLRTHTRKLNALHPPDAHGGIQMVQLYEKGYGKDAAGIAMEAINYARDCRIDVVLVDTAGRMQDNEPLMRSLSKLIKINQPDLVMFVGEALVGNEAVDQLVKFNQALADHSNMDNPRLIDGILLTKFDTIDDKVGAAISMTYTTGQPIVFVGTGQTYRDLKNLNVKAVVNALLKA